MLGGQWDGGVDGRRTYVGGRRACSWISQIMRIGEIWKVLEKETGGSMSCLLYTSDAADE